MLLKTGKPLINPRRNKITFIAWSPDDAGVMVSLHLPASCPSHPDACTRLPPQPQAKMLYASSKEALKRTLTGLATEMQANDSDDIEFDTVLKTVSKGLAGK